MDQEQDETGYSKLSSRLVRRDIPTIPSAYPALSYFIPPIIQHALEILSKLLLALLEGSPLGKYVEIFLRSPMYFDIRSMPLPIAPKNSFVLIILHRCVPRMSIARDILIIVGGKCCII